MLDTDNIIKPNPKLEDRKDFYIHDCSLEKREETKNRLQEIQNLGMTEVGIAEFGIKGVMSGLYIERVWNFTDEEWKSYIDWVKELKFKYAI